MKETKYGIEYSLPEVLLLQDTGIGVSELAARTCYDSFDASENKCVTEFNDLINNNLDFDDKTKEMIKPNIIKDVNDINDSDLLDKLAWTHFHHSILEHANLSFLIRGTSRGVLQEHARHRIQAISVRSTRYTMSNVINAFIASITSKTPNDDFREIMRTFDMFVTIDANYNDLEYDNIFSKLRYQYNKIGKDEFIKISVAKSSLEYLNTHKGLELFQLLQNGKKKRNVGDAFKHIVSDNWKVDMVVTFNIRSLKNYFDLRDSGAAYFQIRWLAQEMKKVTPQKYLKLIDKEYR